MKKQDKTEKMIYRDCEYAMRFSTIVYIVSESLAGFLTVFTAKILGNFTDAIFNGNTSFGLEYITELILCIASTVILVPGIGLIGGILMLKNSLTHERMLQGRFLDKTYDSAMQIEEGEVQYRLEDDATDLRCDWTMLGERICVTPLLFFYVMYQSVMVHFGFTLIVIAISVIQLTVPIAVKKLESRYDKETREYKATVRTYETEFTTNPHVIKMLGISETIIGKMDFIFHKFYTGIFLKKTRCSIVANQISGFLDSFCIFAILLIGAFMVSKGMIKAGAVVAMIGYFSVYNTIISNISWMIRRLPVMKNCVQRLKLLYEDDEDRDGIVIDDVNEIEANQLSFSYEKKQVWNPLNVKIQKGEKVAICGSNGSGKSTFLQVLSGLRKGYEGSLCLNGVELHKVSLKKWRKQFAYITQEPYLFQGTVKENVALGNLNAPEEKILDALQQTNLIALADREISVEKNDLSGGEKQKISIARALLKDTPIILMDEPSNNLDENTVTWLKDFIKKSKKTIIYVSHEETLASLADQKLVIELFPT